MGSHPDSDYADAKPNGSGTFHEMPRWVKLFGVVGIAIVAFALLYHAGCGVWHLAHGGIGADEMSAEHGHHTP